MKKISFKKNNLVFLGIFLLAACGSSPSSEVGSLLSVNEEPFIYARGQLYDDAQYTILWNRTAERMNAPLEWRNKKSNDWIEFALLREENSNWEFDDLLVEVVGEKPSYEGLDQVKSSSNSILNLAKSITNLHKHLKLVDHERNIKGRIEGTNRWLSETLSRGDKWIEKISWHKEDVKRQAPGYRSGGYEAIKKLENQLVDITAEVKNIQEQKIKLENYQSSFDISIIKEKAADIYRYILADASIYDEVEMTLKEIDANPNFNSDLIDEYLQNKDNDNSYEYLNVNFYTDDYLSFSLADIDVDDLTNALERFLNNKRAYLESVKKIDLNYDLKKMIMYDLFESKVSSSDMSRVTDDIIKLVEICPSIVKSIPPSGREAIMDYVSQQISSDSASSHDVCKFGFSQKIFDLYDSKEVIANKLLALAK